MEPPQFSLRGMLLAITLVCAALAVVASGDFFVIFALICILALVAVTFLLTLGQP